MKFHILENPFHYCLNKIINTENSQGKNIIRQRFKGIGGNKSKMKYGLALSAIQAKK